MSGEFKPSHEWQTIRKDQHVPPGLHVRINMQTGEREAKLLDDNDQCQGNKQLVGAEGSAQAPDPAELRAQDPNLPAAKAAARESYDAVQKTQDGESQSSSTTTASDKYRTPKDWQGLLKWSLAYMDGTGKSEFGEMDSERRKWLEDAMSTMDKDEIGLMKEALKVIIDNYDACFNGTLKPEELEAKEHALESLHDLVDLIDNAQDLIPLGGYPAIINMLDAHYPALVWRALNVLATTLQNNPVCQKYCMDQHLLGKLMHLLQNNRHAMVRTKSLYALSGLVRGNHAAAQAFVLGGGIALLKTLIADFREHATIAVKASFMLNQLMVDGALSADSVARVSNMIPTLMQVALESDNNEQLREHVLATLSTLSLDGEAVVNAIYAPELQFKSRLEYLRDRIEEMEPEEIEMRQEQLRHIVSLLSL